MSSALKDVSSELLFIRRDEKDGTLRELSDVVLLSEAEAEDGLSLPAGSIGTVVSVLGGGKAYLVEFATPRPVLATLDPHSIRLM